MIHALLTVALTGFALAAATYDLRTRRIPNMLVVSGFAAAMVLRALLGSEAHLDGLQGAGIAFLVAFPLFAMRAVGGGDAKLLVMVGSFLGPQQLVAGVVVTALAGGALAVIEMVRLGATRRVLRSTVALVGYGLTLGRHGARTSLASPEAVTVPYGVAIAIGAIGGWFL